MHCRHIALALASLTFTAHAARAQMAHPAGMSHQQTVAAAMAGGPASIAQHATIGWIDSAGHFNQMQAGTNGFTCVIVRPDPINGPVCGDRVGTAWLMAFLTGQPAPPAATSPGIAYMAQGGSHYEAADGSILLENDLSPHAAGSHRVTEPAHWMLIYPMDPAVSGLPSMPNGASYIMYAGTPWAHVMVHQDPNQMSAMHH